MTKYEAKLYLNADTDNVEFIGTIYASSVKELKERAKYHARIWGKANKGRICICFGENQIFVNP